MEDHGSLLGGLTPRDFLARHWQKRPLLARGALRDFELPFDADDVLRLACDPKIPSRLVLTPREGSDWSTRRGPLVPDDLSKLPASGWTILLNELDRRFDALAALLDRFRFIPNWRIDDVLVSYATDGGGVGPHMDRYDVFLLQASGCRRWRIGDAPVDDERLVAGLEHPVLESFAPAQEWVLEPGDMIYLPPRIAHEGVALGECMTCSIGFRAPDPRELVAGYLRQLGPAAFEAVRYADPDLEPAEHAGEIAPAVRERLRRSALALFERPGELDDWIGRFVTTPVRRAGIGRGSRMRENGLRRLLDTGGRLRRSAPPHFAWYRGPGDDVLLYVGGERYRLEAGSESLAELLCGRETLDGSTLAPHLDREPLRDVVLDLVLRGYLKPERAEG